jgi:hypothetical protein
MHVSVQIAALKDAQLSKDGTCGRHIAARNAGGVGLNTIVPEGRSPTS